MDRHRCKECLYIKWYHTLVGVQLDALNLLNKIWAVLYVVWYVGCCSNSSAFFLYSAVSMTTSDTPLSAVRTILEVSFFNSLIVFISSLVMLGGLCVFLMKDLTSPLSSSASSCCNLLHACSMVATYSVLGGLLGT